MQQVMGACAVRGHGGTEPVTGPLQGHSERLRAAFQRRSETISLIEYQTQTQLVDKVLEYFVMPFVFELLILLEKCFFERLLFPLNLVTHLIFLVGPVELHLN